VTPLHCAAQYNHVEAVKRLMIASANPDAIDNNGNTPLHFCAQNGHIECARLLLSGMVMVDAQNNRGDTPLHNATRWNDAKLVDMLVKEGASVNLRNKSGQTALDLARRHQVGLAHGRLAAGNSFMHQLCSHSKSLTDTGAPTTCVANRSASLLYPPH
jgi:ankyrin repeat protein